MRHCAQPSVRSVPCVQHLPCQFRRVSKPFLAVQPRRARTNLAQRHVGVTQASGNTHKVEIVLKAEDVGCCSYEQAARTAQQIKQVMRKDNTQGGLPLKEVWEVEEGTELVSMPLSKPLGAVLAEQYGRVVVERMQDGSNAALGGLQIGDRIRGTTARSKEDIKDTAAGSGAQAKQDYWGALVLLNADGQKFDTVMAAINSSKCASCDVTLIVERQIGGPNKASPQSPQGKGVKPGQDVTQ